MLIPLAARSTDVVSLDVVKQAISVEHNEKDDLIRIYIDAAVEHIAKETELTLAPTSMEQRFDCWPICPVTLDMGPVREVDSIVYLDENGTEQDVAAEDFGWEPCDAGALVWFTSSFSRPRLATRPGAVRVLFVAGYNDPDASDGDARLILPNAARVAVMILVAHWWKNRGPTGLPNYSAALPGSLDTLIDSLRCYRS